jgi:hypothetical protein
LQTGTPSECVDFKIVSQGSKILLRTFPSVINLLPDLLWDNQIFV